jgi:hypothetical protein
MMPGGRALLAVAIGAPWIAGCDSCATNARSAAQEPPPFKPLPVLAPSAISAALDAAQAMPRHELTYEYRESPVGRMQVVVVVPAWKPGDPKFPVLITMHGRGESFKGPARGARGWVDDYWLPLALDRLAAPPLTNKDFHGFSDDERLSRLNESLKQKPYRGLIVVCPFTPDILAGDRPFDAARPLAAFLVDELLPRVYRETPALGTPSATGIDGVSLGGRASLLVGFDRPKAFGAIATLQAAFDSADAPELGRRAVHALAENPKVHLRLLTSDGDYFLRANRSISQAFQAASVSHELVIVPGPHDYEFNRGPGVYEMLVFHDRALRGEAAL